VRQASKYLVPCRGERRLLRVDGEICPLPTEDNLCPPQAAIIPDEALVVYIPRGNAERKLEIAGVNLSMAKWIDPRSGDVISIETPFAGQIPERPDPIDEDWVFVAE